MFRVNKVVQITGFSRNTLYRYMKKGTLKYTEVEGIRYIGNDEVEALKLERDSVNTLPDTSHDTSVIRNELRIMRQELSEIRQCQIQILTAMQEILTCQVRISNVSKVCNDTPKAKKETSGVSGGVPSDTPRNVSSDNIRRQNEAYSKVVDVLESYIKSGKPMPQQKEMAAQAGVSPDTFRKHHKRWKNKTA